MTPNAPYGTRGPVVKARIAGGRSDARRNRQRVLETADQVFAAEGMGVPVDEIARRAGVGPGTLYRHFPTKEALFMAVAVNRLSASVEEARRLAKVGDPAVALFRFLSGLSEQFQARKDLFEVLAAGGQNVHDVNPTLRRDLNRAVGALLNRAQAAGAIRRDVGVEDVMNLMVGVYAANQRDRQSRAPNRLLEVVFDGLRTTEGRGAERKAKSQPRFARGRRAQGDEV